MSLFEDLIEELKDENLIEETVIEISKAEQKTTDNKKTAQENELFNNNLSTTNTELSKISTNLSANTSKTSSTATSINQSKNGLSGKIAEQNSGSAENISKDKSNLESSVKDNDFYRRRATEEVTSLQIVEHILSGVEREQLKISPKAYDDISVSVALHDFLQITSNAESAEHSLAEFKLMQETEGWYSALSHRDKFISVADLRRYCETTRPVLSSQALIALARFYRNAPFSDAVRNKFDMVMTRLVTSELKNSFRELLFNRAELIEHLSGLYADWSSIPIYASDDDSTVLLAVMKLEDFIKEAEEAISFEQLISKDFFNRLRNFKDDTGENFFAPLLTATAIICNVIVGNRYVELVNAERESNNSEILEEKYKFLLDQTVSDATGKTLQLITLLKGKKDEPEELAIEESETEEQIVVETLKTSDIKIEAAEESKFVSFSVNKWFLIAALLVIAGIGGLYVWVEKSDSPAASQGVEKVNLEDPQLVEYFKTARINEGTYYAITQPAWKNLGKEAKEEILRKILADGAKKGYKKVHLLSNEGKTIGFASDEKGIELSEF